MAKVEEKTEKVIEQLKTIFDPEIPIDIVELGLIYDITFEKDKCMILMTLTSAWCPVAQDMPVWVKDAAMKVEGIESCIVDVTFEPPWGQDKISEAGQLELGIV